MLLGKAFVLITPRRFRVWFKVTAHVCQGSRPSMTQTHRFRRARKSKSSLAGRCLHIAFPRHCCSIRPPAHLSAFTFASGVVQYIPLFCLATSPSVMFGDCAVRMPTPSAGNDGCLLHFHPESSHNKLRQLICCHITRRPRKHAYSTVKRDLQAPKVPYLAPPFMLVWLLVVR